MNARNITTAAVLAFLAAILAGLLLASTNPTPAPKCTPEHVAALTGGLSYAQGYRAALTVTGADTRMADANMAATQTALDACQ